MTASFTDVRRALYRISDESVRAHREATTDGAKFRSVGIGADGKPTTALDAALESVVVRGLEQSGLARSVLSEESGHISFSSSGFDFVVDPLDGTSNAEMNLPLYALSIAVLRDGELVCGLLHNYATGDRYWAARGAGATRNDTPVHVSDVTRPSRCKVLLSKPFTQEEAALYTRCILESRRVRVTGCPSLDVASVACGDASAHIDYHLGGGLIHTHDVLAARVLLEEAGGLLLDERGEPLSLAMDVTSKYNIFAVNHMETFAAYAGIFGLT